MALQSKTKRPEDWEARFRSLYENLPVGIFRSTPEGRILNCNRYLAHCLGYKSAEELARFNARELYYQPEDRDELLKLLETSAQLEHHELTLKDRDGNPRYFLENCTVHKDADGRIETIEGMLIEITDRKKAEQEKRRLEQQLVRAHQMETIGTLAGGVAHEFNNLLMGILSNAQLGQINSTNYAELEHYFSIIVGQARQGAELVQRILAFSRQTVMQMQLADPAELFRPTIDMLRSSVEENIRFNVEIAAHVDPIRADWHQIQLVITNLVVNARDAMPAGGTLGFRLYQTMVNPELAQRHPDAEPGDYVCISIDDTGEGIPPDLLEKVIDPFYSTKGPGKGTGLGLSQAYGVIRQHNGFVTIDSAVGEGTTVRIYLPVYQPGEDRAEGRKLVEEVPAAAPAEEALPADDSRKLLMGTEQILLVEDSAVVLLAADQLLRTLGYSTMTAESGEKGLEIYRQYGRDIDLVLSDIVMPGISGIELARQLKAVDPEVRVILFSGYSSDPQVTTLIDEGIIQAYLQKPFNTSRMASLIRKVVES